MAGEECMQALARAAMDSAEIAQCLNNNAPAQALERIGRVPGGAAGIAPLKRFRRPYGPGAALLDSREPSPGDDLSLLIQAIKTRLSLAGADPSGRSQLVREQREQATRLALEALARSPLRRRLFRWTLAWAQAGASIREDVFFYALQGWPLARKAFLEQGRRMVQSGRLTAADDVFFLTWAELQEEMEQSETTPQDWRACVESRRREHERCAHATPPAQVPAEGPPETLTFRLKALLKRVLVGSAATDCARQLHGSPASPGTATGPARIIRSTADLAQLQAGDIMVAQATVPEWIPAFALAAGVVTDAGGPLSHSSIVAREFGIPAVMGVQVATRNILDGQLITVNGSLGVVTLLCPSNRSTHLCH